MLEVLVAFVIMGMAVGVLLQSFGASARSARAGEDYSRAALLGQSKLSELAESGVAQLGEQSGRFDDGYHWRASVRRYDEQGAPIAGLDLEPYHIVLDISWSDGPRRRSVSFETVVLSGR